MSASNSSAGMQPRWWVYQRERFPVFAHGLLILSFSLSAVCFSALLRGHTSWPLWSSIVVAFISCFLFFLQLRIADEFKDFAEDSRYRPYRPVPRGLVTLKELGIVGVAGLLIQAALAIVLDYRLLLVLLIVWIYLALMSKEFFVREWIENKPVTYLWTHMLIMPLIDFYATACDWIQYQNTPPNGLIWFLIVSFFNGIVIEIGRKIRAPEDEEEGVKTYTALWGIKTAVIAWMSMITVTALSAYWASRLINFHNVMTGLLLFLWVLALFLAVNFIMSRHRTFAKWFEHFSGIWTLLMYLGLGVIPMIMTIVK
jgi:4-hydroxybenzoate polyprenyltransferase